jgi:putative flippase GtrA
MVLVILNKLLYNKRLWSFFRFLLVGALAAISDTVILFVLVRLFGMWYLTASVISFSLVTLGFFFLQKKFTYEDNSDKYAKQISLFIFVSAMGILINSSLIFLFFNLLGIWYILGSIFAKIILLFWNYFVNKHVTFKNNPFS